MKPRAVALVVGALVALVLAAAGSSAVSRPVGARPRRRARPPAGYVGVTGAWLTPELERYAAELVRGPPKPPGTWEPFSLPHEGALDFRDYGAVWFEDRDGNAGVTLYRRVEVTGEERLPVIPLPPE